MKNPMCDNLWQKNLLASCWKSNQNVDVSGDFDSILSVLGVKPREQKQCFLRELLFAEGTHVCGYLGF